MAAAIAVAATPLSASAHSNDKDYSIAVTSSNSGLSSFVAVIWGGRPNSEATDCTSTEYYSGAARKPAVVRVGQKGYVRQDVYERYGQNTSVHPVAQIFAKYNGATGTTKGVWRPDSVAESGCIYFN